MCEVARRRIGGDSEIRAPSQPSMAHTLIDFNTTYPLLLVVKIVYPASLVSSFLTHEEGISTLRHSDLGIGNAVQQNGHMIDSGYNILTCDIQIPTTQVRVPWVATCSTVFKYREACTKLELSVRVRDCLGGKRLYRLVLDSSYRLIAAERLPLTY